MCGLFGFDLQGVSDVQRAVLLTALSHGNADRGRQSWGIHDVDGWVVHKDTGSIASAPLASMAGVTRLYGHTRQATQGKVSIENAHPFVMPGITGAHNGVVYNHRELNQLHRRAYEVDSMHLLAHVAEGLPLDEIESYGVLVFKRDNDDALYIGRWSGGELALYQTPNGVLFSSEDEVSVSAIRAAGIEGAKRVQVDEGGLYAIRDGRISLVKTLFFTCDRKATQTGTWQTLGGLFSGKRDARGWYDDYSDAWDDDISRASDDDLKRALMVSRVRMIAVDHGMDPAKVDACVRDPGFDPWLDDDPLYVTRKGKGYDSDLYKKVVARLDPTVQFSRKGANRARPGLGR